MSFTASYAGAHAGVRDGQGWRGPEYGTVGLARAEDRATLESDVSAAAGGYTAGQSLRILPFVFLCPAGSPESDKLIA